MHFGYTCDFRSPRTLEEIRAAWNMQGRFEWRSFDNDDRGAYLVSRDPQLNLRIRLYGESPRYSLELDADVAAPQHDEIRQRLLSIVLSLLLPAISATDIRDTSHETSSR